MLRKLVSSRMLSVSLAAFAVLFTAQTASAQLLRDEYDYAKITTNGYTIYNNVWGDNAGPQQLWVYGYNDWGVKAYHTGGGIKSYPNVSKFIGKKLSAITKLDSSFTAVTPANTSGAWALTFDIWNDAKSEEIMLWFNYTGNADGSGNVKPISASYDAQGRAAPAKDRNGNALTNVTIGGSTWNIYKGKNGTINVYSFLRTSKTNSAWVDVKAILNFLRTDSRTQWIGDFTLGDVQHGFEITTCGSSSSNRAEFKFTGYDLWQ